MKFIYQEKLVLASKSPRRKELLEQMGLEFELCPADIDETADQNLGLEAYVTALSHKKAEHIMQMHPGSWVISADTIVAIDKTILGKPRSRKQAVEMLRTLNARQHSVYTGYTIGHYARKQFVTKAVETKVWFKQLSEQEMQWYAGTDEPYDKAGGYGIQGIGAFLVKKIQGSYSNVVGLPICEVMETLLTLNIIRLKENQNDQRKSCNHTGRN